MLRDFGDSAGFRVLARAFCRDYAFPCRNASIIARVGISFISLPPEDPDDLASGLTEVVVPYLRGVVQGELQS